MTRTLMLTFALSLVAAAAFAQTPRVSISAGAAAQPTTASFTDLTTFPYALEAARLQGDYDVGDGVAFDIGATVRIWHKLGAGVAVTSLTRSSSAETTGSFPHPFFFNTNRTGTWSANDLDRKETAVHLSAAWDLWENDRLRVNVFAGPTFFSFDQAVVENLDLVETYPYDTIEATLNTTSVDGSAVGFHAGFDVGWFFTRNVGVGGIVRFTKGTKGGFRVGDGEPFDLALGGVQGGGGVRIRF